MTAAALALLMIVALEPQDASPADSPGVYVQGTLFLNVQPAGTPDTGVEPALEGRSVAVGTQVGRFLTPQLAVEGEFAIGRAIAAAQTSAYSPTYWEDYRVGTRDLLFNANLRWQLRPGARINLVAGGGLAVNRIRQYDRQFTSLYPSRQTYPTPEWLETRHLLTVSGGVDFPIAAGHKLAVVPGVRLRWVDRRADLPSRVGLGAYSLLVGATVRGAFGPPRTPPAPPGRAYVQGAVFLSSNPAGTANHRVRPPLAGGAFGVAGSAGAFVTPQLAVEGEFVLGAAISAPQTFSYNWVEDYTADVRDTLANVNVRAKEGPLEIVFGGGIALTRVRRLNQVTRYPFSPNQPPRHSPDASYHHSTYNIGGGIDAPIRMNSRVALVPSFRFRWVRRPASSQASYVGAGTKAFQAGVTVRVGL